LPVEGGFETDRRPGVAPDTQGLVPDLDVILRKVLPRKKKPKLVAGLGSNVAAEQGLDDVELIASPQDHVPEPPDYRNP